MTRSSKLSEHQHGFNACRVYSLKDILVGDIVLSLDAQDGSQASLLKSLQQLHLLPVADLGFSTVEKSGENCSFIDLDLARQAQEVVLPHSLLETSKGAASFGDAVVYKLGHCCVV